MNLSCSGQGGREIEGFVEFFMGTDSPNPDNALFSKRKLLPNTTSSEITFATIKEWIEQCNRNHDCCGLDPSQWLPTRVLDVSGSGDSTIRLLQNERAEGKYLALSHCWGVPKPHALTLGNNFEEMKRGVPIASLPKTFQDAVVFTRDMGVQYLWIDCLCIIQDVKDDWRRESAQMAAVYQNSYLTITSSHAASSDGGLFHEVHSQYAAKELKVDSNDGNSYAIYVQRLLEHDIHWDNGGSKALYEQCPLLSRAWAFQERLIPPRVLHFRRNEVMWECNEHTRCQCVYEANPWTHGPKTDLSGCEEAVLC
ncbi:HET-domain-containing protein [Mytilinidion resinicola]|uniref:HET-domain-containing protein n=1 Tax=Mytilinidion resinicola TaxID=574789 RepID=A0A6A6YGB7_9PEZI|nr:HET-domain-containing protein [Mytilinidion resinicola]KAF2807618.1 HET-domain-containing protein [Mytilinidion resinicola]